MAEETFEEWAVVQTEGIEPGTRMPAYAKRVEESGGRMVQTFGQEDTARNYLAWLEGERRAELEKAADDEGWERLNRQGILADSNHAWAAWECEKTRKYALARRTVTAWVVQERESV